MNNLAFNVPVNSVSYGNASIAILREVYKRNISPCLFFIGQPDLSAQKEDQEFNLWLQSCSSKIFKRHNRNGVAFKLWHPHQSFESVSKKQALFLFHETDAATEEEVNVVNNQDISFVSSQYTKEVFESYGAKNIIYCPLGFDSWNFRKLNRSLNKDVILWNLSGKREIRKQTDLIASLWVKRFGNNRNHQLNISCFNPHFTHQDGRQVSHEEQVALFVNQVFGGKKPWNVNFYPWLKTNAEVNDLLNAAQIDLTGLSSLEGFNFPLFNSLCLGKWAVVLNAHVHKDYCNDKNSILVEPKGMKVAHDGMFFTNSGGFNRGNWFTFDNDEAIAAMEKALEKVQQSPNNVEGEKLKEQYTYEKTVNTILDGIKKIS